MKYLTIISHRHAQNLSLTLQLPYHKLFAHYCMYFNVIILKYDRQLSFLSFVILLANPFFKYDIKSNSITKPTLLLLFS